MFNIVFLMGPTCVGKTDIALNINACLPVNIISVDSSMIYKYMNIGTGKPNDNILSLVTHHFVNIIDPSENFSVWDFCEKSFYIIKNSFKEKKIPFFVGGTLMYFWYLKFYIDLYNRNNKKYLYNNFINKKDRYFNFDILFEYINFINIVLIPIDKYKIYSKIRIRLNKMIEEGFLSEMEYLHNRKDLNLKNQSIKSIGYKDFWLFFKNKISFNHAYSNTINSTINLFDKQIIWLKKFNTNVIYLEVNDNKINKKVYDIINMYLTYN
jgi:tRNA dimethylallyltransferase